MKVYFKSILAINVGMLLLCVITAVVANDIFVKILSTATLIFWYVSLHNHIKTYVNDEKKSILADVEEEKKEEKAKDVPSTESIYTQLNGLTKDEILWLHEHVENQKTGLIEVNTSKRTGLVSMLNMFGETKGLEHLYEDTKKELDMWDEFYLEQSSMVSRILPKIELLKEAVS